MFLRVIFTKAYEDGPDHWSQKFWTKDIPIPQELVPVFESNGSDICGVEFRKENDGKDD